MEKEVKRKGDRQKKRAKSLEVPLLAVLRGYAWFKAWDFFWSYRGSHVVA